jgi:sigma-B regulation protein RsbU (phosphoserine phosphatase)
MNQTVTEIDRPERGRDMTPTESPAVTGQTIAPGPATAPPVSEDWLERLKAITETMREMSTHTDPQAMVASYGRRVRQMMPSDRWISLSRRGLEYPKYRITRSSTWTETIDPWKQQDKLPLFEGGLLGDLIYGDEPRIIDDIAPSPRTTRRSNTSTGSAR